MDEERYRAEVSFEHRRALGQFFTPPWVARLMVRWLHAEHPQHILDPAFGLGVFFQSFQDLDPAGRWEMTAHEVDPFILQQQTFSCERLSLVCSDYLEEPPRLYDAIVCNPPYMRFQRFKKRHDLVPKIEKMIRKKLKGYINISSIFLVKALHELREGGKLAFLMPFEFFNTGYGEEVKRMLLETHLLKQIVIFPDEKAIFPEVTTTVCLLLCHLDRLAHPIKVTYLHDQEQVHVGQNIEEVYQYQLNASELPPHKKWTPILRSFFTRPLDLDEPVPLSSYGVIRRGLATGANAFFTISQKQAFERGIPEASLRFCLTKSSHLKRSIFTERELMSLVNAEKLIYCLDIQDPTEPATKRYLKEGEKQQYHKRYLCRTRNPWFKLERREPAPLLFGSFHRGRIKVIRNHTQAVHLTCFHAFYPKDVAKIHIDRLFLYFLSDLGQESLRRSHRHYGNGLYKFEPSDLMETLCPNMERLSLLDQKDVECIFDKFSQDEVDGMEHCNRCVTLLWKGAVQKKT